MELYNKAFQEALDQNLLNEEKWINYKKEIAETSKCMNEFLKSCHLDIMVPIGKKAFIRGKLQHTNDILISHNSSYFSLVSNHQANEIMKARIVTCNKQLQAFEKERKLFSDKLEVPKGEAFSENEIIEEYNDEAEIEWRKKHKESVKKQKQIEAKQRKEGTKLDDDVTELLNRYELLEEMVGELDDLNENEMNDDVLSKLINGEMSIPQGRKRIAHDAEETETLDIKSTYILQKYEKNTDKVTNETIEKIIEPPSEPLKEVPVEGSKKKKERRRVTFSSTEDVKVIVPAQEIIEEKLPTIEISFHHSPAKFHPDPQKENISDDDPKFAHPGEFIKFVNSIKAEPETKSILKSKCLTKPKKSMSFKPTNDDDHEEEEFESILRQQTVIGDVIEHKNDAMPIPLTEVQTKSQKVSRFKEMRSKVK